MGRQRAFLRLGRKPHKRRNRYQGYLGNLLGFLTDRQTEDSAPEATGFVHAKGSTVIGTDGKPLIIKGIALGNSVWGNPDTPNPSHHTEETYRELSEMGFNSVRFYLNYGLFESDSKPYSYKESGFEWIDKNIEWAKKYGMGIILNMHYPQGGYQSLGEGSALWTDKSSRDRLTALWKAIAERYAEEPTIWGYGIINEPYVPQLGTYEESAQQYFEYADELTEAIRSVSPYQAVFVEKLCSIKPQDGTETDWGWFTAENTMKTVSDDNVIYEFHFYDPASFTHQDTSWTDYGGKTRAYPSASIASAEYESYWVDCVPASEVNKSGGWSYFETAAQTLSDGYNICYPAMNGGYTESGAAWFDDITLTEIAPDGTKTVLSSYSFDNGSIGNISTWSADGTGAMTYDENGRSGGCVRISGAKNDFTASCEHFEMKEGYSYIVSGYMRYESTGRAPAIRIDFASAEEIYAFDKSYIESVIRSYADFGAENNVPLYMGEFGVAAAGFSEGRGGTEWVKDVISLCFEYGIGFNYHTYHEPSFGLYKSSDNVLPAEKDLNKALAELFEEILR